MMRRRSFLFLAPACLLAVGKGQAAEGGLPPEVPLPSIAREVTVAEAAAILPQQPLTILDVRSAPEVTSQGRIPGSKHVDFFREDFAQAVLQNLKIDPARPCLVYCAIGGRSRRAAQKLADMGFKEVLVLKGGFNAWKKAGHPVETVK